METDSRDQERIQEVRRELELLEEDVGASWVKGRIQLILRLLADLERCEYQEY